MCLLIFVSHHQQPQLKCIAHVIQRENNDKPHNIPQYSNKKLGGKPPSIDEKELTINEVTLLISLTNVNLSVVLRDVCVINKLL